MNNFLLINKPPGITSLDVVKKVRRITNIEKVGHMGTLDPRGCGLLIVALGKAVRLEEYILFYSKTYIVEALFGISSDTYDRESNFFEYYKINKSISASDLEKTLETLKGEIEQEPPIYSAIHINGRRAYDLARNGYNVSLPKRKVHIYNAKLINLESDNNIIRALIELHVSAGTYARSIVHTLGERLGIPATVSFLLRTKIGEISVNESIPYSKIDAHWKDSLIPPHKILNFPILEVSSDLERKILNGNTISIDKHFSSESYVSVINEREEFIAVGRVFQNYLKPEKVFLK
ncbi:MAG TPA: tRNA pseudouridine(55) synthase TruB [Dictyoglomaceae bacterium]|nr:tRNA pseudouridine(55) synthase TruB [Dictyoglomaceae bacterium]HOL39810.1 tRNA pseudouridine(55) synthase TruB [Dictyoglomaceae bacterium]HOP95309.1 tRNA pseudouridine(55) synthase TruB [Dictyoglomaceae bacterium]HPP16225.1 tRNA pseudouridine(55) synthase TruB [Dictyoglomaceae bacterium]HPU42951.1 tRNA pseudouridine(55) synthase TruB [Dictyoglomaceae bacterium]